ncbi:hypothetical protein Tco_1073034, partial [Tanacetum coccineum]
FLTEDGISWNEIIIISSDSSSDLESTDGTSSFDTSSSDSSSDLESTDGPSSFDTSISEDIVYSSPDIVSSKGPYKSLLKWYEDLTYEDIEEFMFSKSGSKKSKAFFLDISKVKASLFAKAYGSSSSKAKASLSSPKTLVIKRNVPIKNYVLGLANGQTWNAIRNKTFGVKIPTTGICTEQKKGKRKV